MNRVEIKGIDLKIDNSITELCKVSNVASSNTRSVLYFIILLNMLSLITVLNTHSYNWIDSRIEKAEEELKKYRSNLEKSQNIESLDAYRSRINYEARARSNVENYLIVRLPLVGYSFDINDLAIVSGFTLSFLLLLLRFTIIREGSNLNIALNAISSRYPNNSNHSEFQTFIEAESKLQSSTEEEVLSKINQTRREHHYNHLSMNEIFSFPPVKSDIKIGGSRLFLALRSKISQLIFFLPSVAYLVITINDYSTLATGSQVNSGHTTINFSLTLLFLFVITLLCYRCNKQENQIAKAYKDFFNNDFELIKPKQ